VTKILRTIGGAAVVAALAVLGTRFLWPRTETLQLPGRTDTVTVTKHAIDSIHVFHLDTVEKVTTDTVNVVTTRWRTRVDTVYRLPTRFYLDWAKLAQARGDTSFFGLIQIGADSAGIYLRRQTEAHVTLGPVRSIQTGPQGVRVDYGRFPTCPLAGLSGLGLDLPFGLKAGPGGACGLAAGGGFDCVGGLSITF